MNFQPPGLPGLADPFEEPAIRRDDELTVDVDGFEGPLDLLLKLARDQKVDLARISILALAEQYLAFIEAARRLRLEIAADYLVMAAWLAYLKSRLLLPEDETDDEPSAEELAEILAHRLRRLEALRAAARRLMAFPRLAIDVFARGAPEPTTVSQSAIWDVRLYDLLAAYGAIRLRKVAARVRLGERRVMSLREARERIVRLLGGNPHWAPLDSYLLEYLGEPELERSARASTLSASLELVREGEVELRQASHFAPLYLRRRLQASPALAEAANG